MSLPRWKLCRESGMERERAVDRDRRARARARRPGRSGAEGRADRRRMGRHRPRRHDLLDRQELSLRAGGARRRGRADRRSRRAGRPQRARTRLRERPQREGHLATSAAAVQRMAGRDLRQVGPGRSQPPDRAGRRQQPQGPEAGAPRPRQLLRIQRRAGERAGLCAAAALPPASARRAARAHHGPDRCLLRLGMAGLRDLLRRDRRAAHAVGAACSSARATMPASAC